jgi:RNA polymerase sigma factor (sigma-70 family)
MAAGVLDTVGGASGGAQFPSTLWTIVRSARDARCGQALETLCRAYWYPLYAYAQRQGHRPEDAQDLTQEFFSRLLADESLASVHESKGRFRSFLLASFKHLLANEWKRTQRQKRGGGQMHFSLDEELAEGRYQPELMDHLDPERLYEKRWAETLLQRVLDRLRDEWEHKEGTRHFDDLKSFLIDKKGTTPFAEAATRLGVSEASLKWGVHKLRQRYRELVREEIAQTVSSPEEVDDEIRHLFSVLV